MASITITLSDQKLQTLQEIAHELGLAPEELLRSRIEIWLTESQGEFEQAAHYVLSKNAELYRRLA